MIFRSVLLAIGASLLLLRVCPAQGDSLSARSVTGEPAMEKNVSHMDPDAERGLAWRWTPADGRRDVGQYFVVPDAFEVRTLAIQVRSAMKNSREKAPFRLSFFHADSANGSLLGKLVAERTGKLPAAGESPKSGQWLVIGFDPVKFDAGRYAFLLEFTDGAEEGQGVVFTIGMAIPGQESGFCGERDDAGKYKPCAPFNFILSSGQGSSASVPSGSSRVLIVDQRGGKAYSSIAAAVKAARAGDTIKLAEGSGPYREVLDIRESGLPGSPITFDGSGETVTGFEPLTGFQNDGPEWTCDLRPILSRLKGVQSFSSENGGWTSNGFPKALPTVLAYRGERLLQSPESGQFSKYALLSEDGGSIVLKEGISPEGWEIGVRPFAIRVHNASHQIYKNVRASGSLNDGFNLHGNGEDLAFENIEAFQNLDEGFSAHDQIRCSIAKGKFWGNDNGIYGNQAELTASDVEIHDNLGFGFGISAGKAKLSKVRIWGNGMSQVVLQPGTSLACTNVVVFALPHAERQWISTQESRKQSMPVLTLINQSSIDGKLEFDAAVEPSSLERP